MPMPVEIEMGEYMEEPGPGAGGEVMERHNLRYDADLAADQASVVNNRIFNAYPAPVSLLSQFSVCCLILNKTIGSGIFAQPYNVVSGAGSSGLALILWVLAPLVCLCAAICWTELALSIPRVRGIDGRMVSTPKSGGNKNYLEYIYKYPDLLITCIYGIPFIILGNLSGNAIQLGVFMETIRDPACTNNPDCLDTRRGPVVAWAIGALVLCAFTNIFTRRGAILFNNIFAVLKVSIVFIMIFVGIGWGTAHGNQCTQISFSSPPKTSLPQGQTQFTGGSFSDVIQAFIFAMYPSTGFEQPFYVLAEVKQPRRKFVPAVMFSMCLILVFSPLLNTAYFCVNPYLGSSSQGPIGYPSSNAAVNYFSTISGASDNDVVRGTAFLFVFSIFANLLAVIYTGPRVKQEIAKEGILPWSLMFATGTDSLLDRWFPPSSQSPYPNDDDDGDDGPPVPRAKEQVPAAATLLHLSWEIILVLSVGLSMSPTDAYNTLSFLYTYVITGILGFLVVAGLLYLKMDAWLHKTVVTGNGGRHWNEKSRWSVPYVGPIPCIIAVIGLGLILFGAFAEPSSGGQSVGTTQQKWWIKPLAGWCTLLLGVVWWLGIQYIERKGLYKSWRKRTTYIEVDRHGDMVQTAEMVEIKKDYY